jgi:hypothetical protein
MSQKTKKKSNRKRHYTDIFEVETYINYLKRVNKSLKKQVKKLKKGSK